MSKLSIPFLIVILAIGLLAPTTIASSSSLTDLVNLDTLVCGNPTIVRLLTDQRMEAGTIAVANDQTSILVTYSTGPNYKLLATHLAVSNTLADIPKTSKGKPIPEQFPFQTSHDNAATFSYTIPLTGLNSTVFIAAQADVTKSRNAQSAWGEGTLFNVKQRSWGMYFTYSIQPCSQPPVAVDDTALVTEDSEATTISVLANDLNPSGDPFTIVSASDPAAGTVTVAGDGLSLSYQPDANACNDGMSTDNFTYTVTPGGSVGHVSVTVTCVNDAPSFTLPANPNQIIVQDAGPQTVLGFATNISPGPANETGQTLTFNVSNDNNTLFTSQPDIDEITGDLTYESATGITGSATISVSLMDNGGTANGGVDSSGTQTFSITVTSTNAVPVAADQTVSTDEDTRKTITLSATDTEGSNLTFSIVNGPLNGSLGSLGVVSCGTGTCTVNVDYTPAANVNGTDGFTFNANDGQSDSNTASVDITVNDVNDPPSFTKGPDQAILEDSGAQIVNGWATIISAGPADEASQIISFNIAGNTNASLFSAGPAVAANGDLTYTPAPDAFGSAIITLEAQDDGGGNDTSASQSFVINVAAVNDAPSFTKGGDQTVNEDSGAQAVPGWASGISAGPNESSQTLSFIMESIDNPTLFSSAPAIAPDGTLTYTPAANQNGVANISVYVQDNGSTANGGVDSSARQSFSITVSPVNDAPSFTSGANVTVAEDSGAYSAAWGTGLSAGPGDESGQSLNFNIQSNNNISLFSAGPSLASDGTLSFTPAADANGTATLSIVLQDDGGTANGGIDMSSPLTFDIIVTAVNDAPVNAVPESQTVNEDTDLVFSSDSGHTLSVADIDAGSGNIQVIVTTLNGTITPAAGSDAEILGSGTSSVTIAGTLTQVNAALDGLKYKGNANYNSTRGAETLTIITDDQGNMGSGGALSDTDTVNITVDAVNDAPSAVAKNYTAQANMKIVGLTGLLTEATDPDMGDGGYTATFTVGAVSVTSPAGGTLSNLNATSGTFDFDPPPGVAGNVTFTYTVCDSGNPGPSLCSAPATATVNVSGPVIWFVNATVPGPGTGTLADPFKTLASADAVDAVNHRIFLYSGQYATGITLNVGEWLVSQRVLGFGTNGFDTLMGITPPAGTISRPTIGFGAGRIQGTVTLASNVIVKAIEVNVSGATQGIVGSGGLTGVDVSQTSIITATGTALSLNNINGVLTLDNVSANGAPTGIELTNVSATISTSSGTIQNTTIAGVSVDGGTGNYSFSFSNLLNSTGRTILVQNRDQGTVIFTGSITGGGTGILLNNNTGSTITFPAGTAMNLSTGVNDAFTATGGGTVSVAGGTSTITTTSGIALKVENTSIGPSGLVFRRITAGTGIGSSGIGISLVNTGTGAGNGSLVVAGTGTSGSGGTIQHKTGGDGSTTEGLGIYLSQTKSPSFSWMQLNDFDNFAIRGQQIAGLTLNNVVISGANGNDAGESSISLENAGGTITLGNSNISGGYEDNLRVLYNSATAGPATVFNVSNTTFRDLQATAQNAQVNLSSTTAASNSWNVTFNFTGNTFENDANTLPPGSTENFSDGILAAFEGPFQHTLNIQTSTFHHLFQALDTASNFSADVNYVLKNNTITFTEDVAAIALGSGSSSTAQSFLTALLQGNTIGTSGVAQSGNRLGFGIILDMRGEEIAQFTVHSNIIQRTEQNGIQVIGQTAADGDLNLQLTNNLIREIEDDAGAGVIYGIEVTTDTLSSHDMCLDARNNDSFNINAHDIRVRQATLNNIFAIESFAGNGTIAAEVEAFLAAQNPGNTTNVRTESSVVNYTSASSCTTPATQ